MEGDFCQYASGFTLCHFNPLPPHGGRRSHSEIGRNHIKDFNPLPPHGGRLNDIVDSLLPLHFNPLPPHGGRLSRETFFSTCVPFQSTPSAWRETYDIDGNGDWITFQSTPSAWRETLGAFDEIGVYSISIHSLRMEGDSAIVQCALFQHISIHSLRMEGDFTPALILSIASYFNPLPPHGGRRVIFYIYYTTQSISIHSLRMEGDSGGSVLLFMAVVFQSTPSAWRETWNADRKEQE